MREELQELWRYRDLLRQFVARDLKVRYKNSLLGFVWSIVPPLLQVLVFTFFYRNVLQQENRNMAPYLLCGLIPWTFFSTAVLDTCQSVLVNYTIIRKAYIPREILPLYYICSNLVHFLLSWSVFFVIFYIVRPLMGVSLPVERTLIYFPIITLMEVMLVAGLGLWVSALNVFYEDVKYIVQTLFSLLLFLLPILYPADNVYWTPFMQEHPWAFQLYMLNPITAIINAYRKTILQAVPVGSFNNPNPPLPMDWTSFVGSFVLTCLILWSGYWYFNRRKWQFVEKP